MDKTLIGRLRKRAEIRRSIPRGEPDRISDILEEAADALESMATKEKRVFHYLHDLVGYCGHCGNSQCDAKYDHSVLPEYILTNHLIEAFHAADKAIEAKEVTNERLRM